MNAALLQIGKLELVPALSLRPAFVAADNAPPAQNGYQAALTQQQSNAPVFAGNVTPSAPGTYTSTNGKAYVVPAARIAHRANMPRTPDVTFKRDAQTTTLVMTVELVLPDGTDPAATVLLMDNFVARIVPGDNSANFEFTQIVPLQLTGRASSVIGVLQLSGPIDETIGLGLLSDKPGATLFVSGRVQYGRSELRRTFEPPPDGPFTESELRPRIMQEPQIVRPGAAALHFSPAESLVLEREAIRPDLLYRGGYTTVVVSTTVDAVLTNALTTYFRKDLGDNLPIFAALLGGAGDASVWSQETGHGYTRPAPSGDDFYTLPQEYRLALDSNVGLPSMRVIVVSTPPATPDGSTSYLVRVRFAIAPLLYGANTELIRAALRAQYTIPYPTISIGGYTSATFVPSALFANLPGFGGDGGAGTAAQPPQAVDAASGFELVMDCSLEFYTLLTKLLITAEGISGSVQFTIVTGRDATNPSLETTTLVSVPVTLSLIGPMAVVPATSLQAAPPDPTATSLTLSITNPLAVPLAVDGIFPALIETDSQLQITTAATTLQPQVPTANLAPNGSLAVVAQSPDGKPLPAFTGLVTSFGTTTPTFDPAAVLAHYHELAASSGISSVAHFSCYLLKHPAQIPPSLTGLIGVQIEVQRSSGPVVTLPLTLDAPEGDVHIPYSFEDLLAGLSLDEPTFKYRVKNVFPDRTGDFTTFIDNTGRDVLVTPV